MFEIRGKIDTYPSAELINLNDINEMMERMMEILTRFILFNKGDILDKNGHRLLFRSSVFQLLLRGLFGGITKGEITLIPIVQAISVCYSLSLFRIRIMSLLFAVVAFLAFTEKQIPTYSTLSAMMIAGLIGIVMYILAYLNAALVFRSRLRKFIRVNIGYLVKSKKNTTALKLSE